MQRRPRQQEFGTRRLAPLAGDGWRPELPVESGSRAKSGIPDALSPSHPQFWNEPGGEYVRFVGVAVSGAQIVARDAA